MTLVDTGEDTQTGGRIRRVADYLGGERFCLTYGDGVADIDVTASIAFHEAAGARCTMTAVSPPGRFGAVEIEGDRVARFAEKPRGDGGTINGGFFVCEPGVLDLVDGDTSVWEQGPLNAMAAAGDLAAYRHDGFWQPMGHPAREEPARGAVGQRQCTLAGLGLTAFAKRLAHSYGNQR